MTLLDTTICQMPVYPGLCGHDLPCIVHETTTDQRLERLTQPDWCNDPQPGNWHNACMRLPGHAGAHACRKDYRQDEAWYWHTGATGVRYLPAIEFPDLWDIEDGGLFYRHGWTQFYKMRGPAA